MSQGLYLVAHIAGRGVLFDAAKVDSVVDVGVVSPAPGAGAAVLGLAAMRSRVATLIDTRRLLDLPAREGAALPGRAVVTLINGHLYALAVDTLEDVAEHEVVPPPAGMKLEGAWSMVAGVADVRGDTFLLLDMEALIAGVDSPFERAR